MNQYDIIKRPVITEKTNIQKEENNQVSFEVDMRANRVEIARAIEKIFNVKVAKTRTVHVKGKIKRRGRILGNARTGKRPS
jgi:large subunit ribosomal protein L23